MRKHLAPIILFAGAALLIIFAVGAKIRDFRNGNFFAAIGLQDTTSSQDTASSATSTPTLADTLQQFQDQIQSLSSQIADLRSESKINNLRSIFTRTLKQGDTGEDVNKLQELLMKFPEFYPSDIDSSSTVTGFYGSLTKAAVMQFQSQTGLQETGVFDYGTREEFYESISALAGESTSTEFSPIDISSIADLKNSADLKISDGSSSQISTTTEVGITDLQNQIAQLSSDLADAKAAISDLQNQLAALQSTAPSPLSPTPVPASTSSLAISNIKVTNIARQSATVTWTTNSSSNSEVDYSTDTNLSASKMLILSSSTAVTNHAVGLQNLNSGTKYYYRVLSKDSTNTTASSTIQNFTTLI